METVLTGFKLFQKRNHLFIPLILIGLLLSRPLPRGFELPILSAASLGILLGIALRLWSVGYLDRRHSGSIYFSADRLVTAGPYAYCRNPIYFANLLEALALILIAYSPLLFLGWLAMLIVYWQIILTEEAFLKERFGKDFDDYAAQVPRLLPSLTPYAQKSGIFALRKATYKEVQSTLTPILTALLFYFAKRVDMLGLFLRY